MLFVQFGINSTRDVWKFHQAGLAQRPVQFWQNFQTSLVLLIPNCTHHCIITYTYLIKGRWWLNQLRFYGTPLNVG